MATKREQSELEILLNAEQTKKELKEVEERLKLLNKEKKELKDVGFAPDSAAALRYRELDKEIRAANKSRKELSNSFKESLTVIINGDVAGKSLNNLRAALRLAKADFNKMIDPADMARQAASINVIQKQIDKLEAPIKKTTGFWQGLGKEVKAFGVLAASYLGFQFISSKISNIIEKNAKLSDSFADVQRVAGLTKTEVGLLNEQLGKIDTRTGRAELLSIAVVAGKLGVAKVDIYDFTKSVDQLVVALGDELGNADEITTQLGKILNVFKGKVTADDLTKLGNAFVKLANNGVATGGFIADFTQRVSGIAKASNLSLGATVGLSAGFEELGLRSESSATALQKLLSNIASDTPKAAKIAGIELSKFNELFGKTPEQALIAYARGLVKNKESFSEIAKQFKDAGEDGARVVQTLQAIGQSGEFLSEKINLGNASLKESNAIMDAFALKNEIHLEPS